MVSYYEDYSSVASASTLFSDLRFNSTFDPLPEELVGSLYDELTSSSSVVPSSSSTTSTTTTTTAQDSLVFTPTSSFTLDSDEFLSSFDNEEIIEQLLSSDQIDFVEQPQPQQPPITFQFQVQQVDSPNSLLVSSPWNSSSVASSPSSSVPSSPHFAMSPFLSSPVSPACWVPLSPNSNHLLYSNTPMYFPSSASSASSSSSSSPHSTSFAPALLKGPLTSNDCAVCEMIPAKKVAVSVRGKPLITTTLKEFYGERIREEAITNALLLDSHPQFTSHDDAVGSIYILRSVSARKPPQIAKKAFNCHTRKEAGLAHWQYNVPGTDFTCRVSEWMVDGIMYNSYHYYRSPLARPSRRVTPY